ncbi:DUF1904 family protein [Paenibacillus mendelii]|uniref:DUF1904 family protein n=1 Tax=Paenibacillus mendelii TaxID=206163 RepID=A0ABV6JC36_9BACL|nr:DUF1904 family protein [Paenibacillus mendelii]MCQ6562728.1 DUF1904 domain-containing protein [Paenibacillus mendelii]
MPQLNVRGIAFDEMAGISSALIHELAGICECGTDNFTIDLLQTVSVFDGRQVDTYPFIEVAWFERGQAVRDRLAEAITRHIRAAGVEDVEVAFKVYRENGYYVNGRPCGE